MKIDKISADLIISERIFDCYLMYTSKEYYLFKFENDSYTAVKINIKDNPNDVETSFLNIDFKNDGLEKISNDSSYNSELKFLMLHLEMIGFNTQKQLDFITESLYDLAEIYCGYKDRFKRFDEITDENLILKIETISSEIERNKKDSVINELYTAFKYRKGIRKAIRDLGNYLNINHGIILRKNSHEIYKLDKINNGYDSISIDEIIGFLTEIFNEKNLFSTTQVENAVDYISDRLSPEYNIVKFNNGLYDMQQHKLFKPEDPIFTLIESPYNYNPNAEPKYIKDFLYSSLKRESASETDKYVTGVLEYIGYLFTSGNSRNILGWITGIGGGGKSTFANIIQAIFGDKCADLDFADIEKDSHSTSILVGNHLNIVREAKTDVVTDNKPYKVLVGNEPIKINPKNQQPYMLPKDEVAKSVMVANNIPKFKNPVTSIIQRFLIIEFKKVFRNTDEMIENLDDLIIESDDDMEWLIYNSLEAYKNMVESGDGFILKVDDEKTKELMYKHSKPLNFLVSKLISKHDATAYKTETELFEESANGETAFISPYIKADEFNELIVYLSKIEGVEIPLSEKTGKIDGRLLNKAIKDEFELHDYYLLLDNGNTKKYSSINTRIKGKQQKVYPELIKSDMYDELMNELNNEKFGAEYDEKFGAVIDEHMKK
ncbi:MAG: hypothetical protein IKJ72_02375 [Mycoplasmataceae bacterium]|nr:hypothetical protein [bacterium]MBR3832455.1 hypothetical protein [Mycoplasmataceae bacterium]